MHEMAADRTPLPSTFEHGGVPVEFLVAYPTMLGLNAKQKWFPFSRPLSNTHSAEVYPVTQEKYKWGLFMRAFAPARKPT